MALSTARIPAEQSIKDPEVGSILSQVLHPTRAKETSKMKAPVSLFQGRSALTTCASRQPRQDSRAGRSRGTSFWQLSSKGPTEEHRQLG